MEAGRLNGKTFGRQFLFLGFFLAKRGDGVVTLQHENMLDMDELFFTNSCQVLMADVEKEAYEQVYGALPVMVRLPK